MEDEKCKKLIATFQDKLMLGRTKNLNFHTGDNITVKIEQLGIRIITVEAEQEELFKELYGIFTKVERLLMILDGRFVTLKEMDLLLLEESRLIQNGFSQLRMNLKIL